MLAVKGMIQGNMVVVDDEMLKNYEGKDVIVTILDYPYGKERKKIDFDKYITPTTRGENVEAYMEEMRSNDRV